MNSDTQALGELAHDRALSYRFLASMLFNEPTAEFLQAASENPPVAEGALSRYFASLPGGSIEQARLDAASEFASLLLGMSPRPVAVYESVYTSPLGLMMQDARDDVRALYQSQGFSVSEDLHLPDDHMSFELEFMALMCEKEERCLEAGDAAALGECRRVQEVFLKDHLCVWAFDFCDDLSKKAKSDFYRGIAETLSRFIKEEMSEFGLGSAGE